MNEDHLVVVDRVGEHISHHQVPHEVVLPVDRVPVLLCVTRMHASQPRIQARLARPLTHAHVLSLLKPLLCSKSV